MSPRLASAQVTVLSRSDSIWSSGAFEDDVRENLVGVGHLRKIALARVELGGDCHVAELGQAAGRLLDVFVHAEDFFDHENDREYAGAVRLRAVGWDVALERGDGDLAGDEAVVVGVDRRRFGAGDRQR